MQLLELDGSSISKRRVFALPVINHFEVLEDFLLGLLPSLETAVMDQLRFKGVEEAPTPSTSALAFFSTRHGVTSFDQLYDNTRLRAWSLTRRKADIYKIIILIYL